MSDEGGRGRTHTRVELEGTIDEPRALAQDVEALREEKRRLLGEVDALRAETEYLLALNGKEPQTGFNRRSFERALEREVARASRESGAKFSVVRVRVDDGVPPWFPGFLLQTVRVCDICSRVARDEFVLFLHGAGGLGRRLFARRFLAALEAAEGAQATDALDVAIGAATYPNDAETPRELLAFAGEAVRPLRRDRPRRAPTQRKRVGRRADRILTRPPTGVAKEPQPKRPDPAEVLHHLEEAAHQQASGEVVVRAGDVVGRVYVHRGRIAWAHCTSRNVSLAEFLIDEWGADSNDVRFAFTHCRQQGGNFAETLIEFGMLDRDEMRTVLECHIRAHLEAIERLPAPEVLFLPQSRVYNSDLLFDLDEVTGEKRARDAIVAALKQR